MPPTAVAPSDLRLSPAASADAAWLRRIADHHRRLAELGRRREAEARARHPGR